MTTIYKKLFLLLMLIVLMLQAVKAQEIDNIIGEKLFLKSEILGETRDIQIYLPESYHSSQVEYPVLYILDGQRLFLHGVSILQTFRSTVKISPEFIVVGINNKYPDRFNHFQQPDFLNFIEKELINYVDKSYRTTNERILYGWEFAGAYVLESLISKPKLFSGHIAASPYPIDETWFSEKTRLALLKDKLNRGLSSHLYFSVSLGEVTVKAGTDSLNTLLAAKTSDSMRWKYRILSDEQHLSTSIATLYQGLKDYFYGYKIFQIDGLNQFLNAGGIKNFYQYNKIRAERFGFSEKPIPWSMFTIVRNAMRADDFNQFKLFMNEFKASDMIQKIALRESNAITQYYLQYKHYDEAIKVYQTMAKAHPDNARIQNALGDIYLILKQKKITKMYYKKAVELAEKLKDEKLSEYQKDLAEL